MKAENVLSLILDGLVSACASVAPADAQTQEKPTVKIPEPGVPEIMTMEGKFVRAAYNNEGYVILGYQLANRTLGEKWMLLEVGMTVRDGVPNYTLPLRLPHTQIIPALSESMSHAIPDMEWRTQESQGHA